MIALLLLMIADAPLAEARPAVSRIAVTTVTIIRAEPVAVLSPAPSAKQPDRQYRQRDAVPMVEFF